MEHEIWKDIPGYVGLYQVSNIGNVRGLVFTNNQVTKPKIHPIAKTDNGNGYLIVSFRGNGKRKNFYVHRLVAEAFCDNPDGKKYVNHLDYNKYNNRWENLEWCTQRENIHYSIKHMRKPRNHTMSRYIRNRYGTYSVEFSPGKKYKTFKTLEEAIAYRDNAEREFYGQHSTEN